MWEVGLIDLFTIKRTDMALRPTDGKYRLKEAITRKYCSQYGPSGTGILGPQCQENRNVILRNGDVVYIQNWFFDDDVKVNQWVGVTLQDIPLINGMTHPSAHLPISSLEKVADTTPIRVTNWSAPDNLPTVITHGSPSKWSGILPDSKQGRILLITLIVLAAAYFIFKPK